MRYLLLIYDEPSALPESKEAFDAMMQMKKIDIAAIEAARLTGPCVGLHAPPGHAADRLKLPRNAETRATERQIRQSQPPRT